MTSRAQPGKALDTASLLSEYTQTRSPAIRNQLVEANRPLAHHFANRYAGRGVPLDDLRQIALLGLVRALERFEPDRGVAFSTFAGLVVEGTLKEHFRDRTWAVHVPRRAKELHLSLRRLEETFTQESGRSPTVRDLARAAGVSEDAVVEALSAGAAYSSTSLEAGMVATGHFENLTRVEDDGFAEVEQRSTVVSLLRLLPDRERQIVELRFYEGLSQSDIADRVGVSQMHVSRLLRRALVLLRASIERSSS